MPTDDLGPIVQKFRTSTPQAVMLLVVAALLGGVAGLFVWMDDRRHNMLPVTIIAAGAALGFLGWGIKVISGRLEVRERGVSIRGVLQHINITFDQIENFGLRQRTVRGMPGSYSGVWIRNRSGKVIIFPLESNVPQAGELIGRAVQAARLRSVPAAQVQ